MRLDEWQKYIDSQFLDEEPEPVPAPKASKSNEEVALAKSLPQETAKQASEAEIVTQEALFTAVFSEEPDPALLAAPNTTPIVIQNTVTMVVAPPQPPVLPPMGHTPRIEILTPLPETTEPKESKPAVPGVDEVSNRTRRRSQVAEASPVPSNDTSLTSSLFEPISDLDAEIPVFQRYLPSSHAAAMPAEIPSQIGLQSPLPFLPETTATDTVIIAIQEECDAEQSDLPDPFLKHPILDNLSEEEGASSVDTETDRVRRAPKSRARHARNVRPENVPSGLSAAELWAAVPRHVQTLLSLERLEEKEVAQFSYKRQFQEKRHELIERLLDPILSLEDTARLLNVCPTTVRRYTNKGILTYYRKEPERSLRNGSEISAGETTASNEKETRQRRFRLSDILAFLETQQTAIESDRQAEHQAERRRLARAATTITAPPLEPNTVSDAPSTGKDS